MSADPARQKRIETLHCAVKDRILILDGAMGTMIQRANLTEADYRGERFADWPVDPKGNSDLLSLTRPDLIEAIHTEYFEAGSDFATTNTFSATTVAQADYQMESLARELNVAGAALARKAADKMTKKTPEKPRWVIGALGPTNRMTSMSADVNDPGARAITFDELRDAYREATLGLMEGGADLLMVETIFDTLNAKAALFAVDEAFEETGEKLPVMISGTITDLSGRTLSGQTPEAFWNSVRHVKPFSVGFNCALGAEQLRPHVAAVARISDVQISAHPNAGLPNAFGGYDEQPEDTASHIGEWASSGIVNIVGGCCGTTPEHIAAMAESVKDVVPRKPVTPTPALRLSGLEPFELK